MLSPAPARTFASHALRIFTFLGIGWAVATPTPALAGDDRPPEVTQMYPESVSNWLRPGIAAMFHDPPDLTSGEASGVNADAVRMWVDGTEITPIAHIFENSAAFQPPANLAIGTHTAEYLIADYAGNVTTYRHDFRIVAEGSAVCAADVDVSLPTAQFRVPVILSGGPGEIDAFGFDIRYEDDDIRFASIESSGLTTGWSPFEGLESTPGRIRIGGFSDTPSVASDPDTLCYLVFDVESARPEDSELRLEAPVDDLAGFPSPCLSVLRFTSTPDSVCPRGSQVFVPSDTVRVPIVITGDARGFDAFGLELAFDPGVLTWVRTDETNLTDSWEIFDSDTLSSGRLRIGGFDDQANSPSDPDTLGVAVFRLTNPSTTPRMTTVSVSDFRDDLEGVPEGCEAIIDFVRPPDSVCPTDETVFVRDGDLKIPVVITGDADTGPIDAFGFDFSFDFNKVRFDSIARGNFTADDGANGWDPFEGTPIGDGRVRVGAFHRGGGLDLFSSPDTAAILCFTILPTASDTMHVSTFNFKDDFETTMPDPCVATVTFLSPPDSICALGQDVVKVFVADSLVQVPVIITGNPTPFDTLGFDLMFDPGLLSVMQVDPGRLTNTFTIRDSVIVPGLLRFSATAAAPVLSTNPDTVAVITFAMNERAKGLSPLVTMNYTGQFEGAAAPTCTNHLMFLRPPDFVCPIEQEALVPNLPAIGTVDVPLVFLGNPTVFDTLSLAIQFDPAVLTFTPPPTPGSFLDPNWTLNVAEEAAGLLRVTASSLVPEAPVDGDTLAVFRFDIASSASGTTLIKTTDFGADIAPVPECGATIAFVRPPETVCPVDTTAFVPDGKVNIPVVITGQSGPIDSLAITFEFDSPPLSFVEINPFRVASPFDFFAATPTGNRVTLIATATRPFTPSDPDTLAELVLQVAPDAVDSAEVRTLDLGADFATAPPCTGIVRFVTAPDSICPIATEASAADSTVQVAIVARGVGGPVSQGNFRVVADSAILRSKEVVLPGNYPWDMGPVAKANGDTVFVAGQNVTPKAIADGDTLAIVVYNVIATMADSTTILTTGFGGDFRTVPNCTSSVRVIAPPDSVCPVDLEVTESDSLIVVPLIASGGGPTDSLQFDVILAAARYEALRLDAGDFAWDTLDTMVIGDTLRITATTTPPRNLGNPETIASAVYRRVATMAGVDTIRTTNFRQDFRGTPDCLRTITLVAQPDSVCPIGTEVVTLDSLVAIPIVAAGGGGPIDSVGFDLLFNAANFAPVRVDPGSFPWATLDSMVLGDTLRIDATVSPAMTFADPETLAIALFDIVGTMAGDDTVRTTNFRQDLRGLRDCADLITLVASPDSICPPALRELARTDTVHVPLIAFGGGGPADSFALDLCFNDANLNPRGVLPGRLTRTDWTLAFDASVAGKFRVVATADAAPALLTDPDTVAVAVFDIKPAANGTDTLRTTNFAGDFEGLPDCNGLLSFAARPDSVCPVDTRVFIGEGEVRVPIAIFGGAGALDDVEFQLCFDRHDLKFDRVENSGFTDDWNPFEGVLVGDDKIRVTGTTGTPEAPMAPADTLVYVVFDILPGAKGMSELRTTAFSNDLEGLPDCTGKVTFLRCQVCPGEVKVALTDTEVLVPIYVTDSDIDTDTDTDTDTDDDTDTDTDTDTDSDSDTECDPISKFAFDLCFDPLFLTLQRILPTPFTLDWDVFDFAPGDSGKVEIVGENAEAERPKDGEAIAYAIFDVSATPPDSSRFNVTNFRDDFLGLPDCESPLLFRECDECDGGVNQLTLRSLCAASAQVHVEDNAGRKVFRGLIEAGEEFSFASRMNKGFGREIEVYVSGERDAEFRTDCDRAIGPGTRDGNFEVVRGSSRRGGALCDPGPCDDGRPCVLTMRYVGGNCMSTTNTQNGEVECSGGTSAPSVRIVASNEELEFDEFLPTARDRLLDAEIWFNGEVGINEPFDIDATNDDRDRLSSRTFVYFLEPGTENVLHFLSFRTKCDEPLSLGDQFGAIVLEGFQAEGTCEAPLTLDRPVLWPANHKMLPIHARVSCPGTDTIVLESITSNEPDMSDATGDQPGDIVGAAFGTADMDFELRSETLGLGTSRVYEVTYRRTSELGETTLLTQTVTVPGAANGTARASIGFDVTGTAINPGDEWFAFAVLSETLPEGTLSFDATNINGSSASIGNTAGVLQAVDFVKDDLDFDGHQDVVLLFSTKKALALLDASDRLDGPIGLQYSIYGETHFLVPDMFALGEPIPWNGVGPATNTSPDASLPTHTQFSSVFPNPFRGQTTFSFAIEAPTRVRMTVYDTRGAVVSRVLNRVLDAGHHAIPWRGRSHLGHQLATGVYFVRLEAGAVSETRKVVVLH